jgi:oxazoline/thiazoline dehydrogenase
MQGLLADAQQATGFTGRPQVLITIASRFARIGWKYRGMGYGAQLKNVGAIYQTMYLVATAMGLAPSGLGNGDADRFARMTGLDYLEEGSIGEFMLGRPA